MVGGPYAVDWDNDNLFDQFDIYDSVTHDFGVAGTYTIRIWGAYDAIYFNGEGDRQKIISLDQWGQRAWGDMLDAFSGAVNMAVPATDAPDFSGVTDMRFMFFGAANANPDTRDWDTSAVVNMAHMFQDATLANPDVKGWDTGNVVSTRNMFKNATNFDRNVGNWDVSSLTIAEDMFDGVALSTPNYDALLIGWNAQSLQPGVTFSGGNSTYCLDQADTARGNMIASDGWAVTDGGRTCTPPAPTDHFVTTWQTDNPGTSGPTSITVPMVGGPYHVDWDNDRVFDEFGLHDSVTHDFGSAGTYTIRVWGDYSSIHFGWVGDKLKILTLNQWGTGSWATMRQAFAGAENLKVPATDVPNLSSVDNMVSMFASAHSANPDVSTWNTENVEKMTAVFFLAISANPDVSNWNTANVTNMSAMFAHAYSARPDVSGWNTANVQNMSNMFNTADSANPDVSGWNTANVNYMTRMFANTDSANPDVSGWDTSSVRGMSEMFFNASVANPDVSGWNTSNVTNMSGMFYAARSFDQNLGSWNVSALQDATEMLTDVELSTPNYDALLEGWGNQVLQQGVAFDGGNSTYCSTAAATARANMISSYNWLITDGGEYCESPEDVIFTDSFESPTAPLNDTGIDWGADYPDGNNATCTGETIAAQDCSNGRDATHDDDSDGHAGFSFTKLDANGDALPASAGVWDCVRDEVTGLTWEVKTDDGGLRDTDNTYSWYNPDSGTNGGNSGSQNGGACTGSNCDTYSYIQAVNAQALCGQSDWRMPWREELRSIADLSRIRPALDTVFFPNEGEGSRV